MSFLKGINNRGSLERKLARTLEELQNIQKKYSALLEQYNQVMADIQTQNSKDSIVSLYLSGAEDVHPVLKSYLLDTFENVKRKKEGKRYMELREFAALESYFGKRTCSILESTLMLPSYRTTLIYRKEMLAELGFQDSIFDSSYENIPLLLDINDFNPDMKAILLVDAAYVTPYVSVKEDGTVIGLTDLTSVSIELANLLIEDERLFHKFLKSVKNSIINSVFVFMLAPIDTTHKAFPIYYVPSTNGAATEDTLETLQSLLILFKEMGITIYGVATDGDHQYIQYSTQILDSIITKFLLFCYSDITVFIETNIEYFHFSDPFHLVKRDRYKKIKSGFFNCSPNPNDGTRTNKDLKAIGISKYILDNELSRKMEDSLPMKMFSLEIIKNIVEANDIQLLIYMLPSALLLHSIHTRDLDREARIEELLFGTAIVLLYEIYENDYLKRTDYFTKSERKIYKLLMPFTLDWCAEYISLAISIVYLLLEEEGLNLGSCGTHYIEHLFGNIRRTSQGDDTLERFVSSMESVVSESALSTICGVELPKVSNRHDSGTLVTDPIIGETYNMINYIIQAKALFNNFGELPDVGLLDGVCDVEEAMSMEDCIELIPQFFGKQPHQISTKKIGITSTGGLCNVRKWKANEQIKS